MDIRFIYLNPEVKLATELISLGILFLCAIIGGIIANRLKQPAVFGLLLVGAIIGPSSLNLVKDANMIKIMADFGAILMLFIIGLEFDVSKLVKLGARSILIGLLKVAIILFFGYEMTLLLGFSSKIALFAGVILSFSSTVVVVKILEQKEMFRRKEVPLLIAGQREVALGKSCCGSWGGLRPAHAPSARRLGASEPARLCGALRREPTLQADHVFPVFRVLPDLSLLHV